MTTRFIEICAASASAIALTLAGTAAAQSYTAEEDAAADAMELNRIQLAAFTGVETETNRMVVDAEGSVSVNSSWEAKTAEWDAASMASVKQCIAVDQACSVAVNNAAGVLVFPKLTSASFVVGGTGGTGVLWVDGEVAGYYDLAAGSLGFQAGIEQVSQIMTFNTEGALADLMDDPEWRQGAEMNITVIEAGASAEAIADGDLDSLGEVSAFTYNQQGLAGGVAVESIRLSKRTG